MLDVATVVVKERSAINARKVGVIQLNRPKSLNALDLDMVRQMLEALRRWQDQPEIGCVCLMGLGERGFCAGGDVRAIQQSDNLAAVGEAFFSTEYALDYLIHTYPKPIICWGHGYVMGGGVGLMVGASHRVVTPSTRWAMPEISIGLYPDVGASWFLSRLPGSLGLFLGITGAQLEADDVVQLGLADVCLSDGQQDALIDQLCQLPSFSRAAIDGLLQCMTGRSAMEPASVRAPILDRLPLINSLSRGHDLSVIEVRARDYLRSIDSESVESDVWVSSALKSFLAGSALTARVVFELLKRGRHLSLSECFEMEARVSRGMTQQPDFYEGVRAQLVDKDRNPQWAYASVSEVPDDLIERLFGET